MMNPQYIGLLLSIFAISKGFAPVTKLSRQAWSVRTVFGGGTSAISSSSKESELPRDVKEAVSKCRVAVQEALRQKISRMDIEMPVGTKFGVEKSKAARASMDDKDGGPSKDQLDMSDRELARIFVEMFQPLGGDHITVVFNDDNMADLAKKRWKGDASASSRIVALNRRKTIAKKANKAKGFAAKMNAEFSSSESSGGPFQLPEKTEIALFVAPGPKELVIVEKICKEVGMGTLVVLLNARLSNIDNFGTEEARKLFLVDFEPVFHLRAAPQHLAPGCLMHRAFPNTWVLARKPKVGKPKAILLQEMCPTDDECAAAYHTIEVGDVEKSVENILDSVSNFFR